MSAAFLREAADAIRDDWSPARGSAWTASQNFHLAVADWLDNEATTAVVVEHSTAALAVAAAYLLRQP